MAGAEGFEPPLAVLETAGLPLNLRPFSTPVYPVGGAYAQEADKSASYLISLWEWCLRQNGQNFLISSRSVMVFLFFMLV